MPNDKPVSLDDVLGGGQGPFTPDNGGTSPPATPPATPPTPPSGQEPTGGTPPQEPTTHIPPTGDTLDSYEGIINVLSKTELTTVEQEIKDGLYSMFNASNVNQNGDLLDKDGNVIINAATLKEYVENDKLPLNENGDLVDVNGNVIKSSIDLAKNESVVEYTKLKLEQELGIAFPADLQVDDTEEGIAALTLKAIELKTQNAVLSFLNSNPSLKDFYQHLALGNDPKSFSGDFTDYSKIDIKTLSLEAKIQLIEKSYKEQGIENPVKFIELLKKGGEDNINAEAKEAKTFLEESTELKRLEKDKELKAKEEQRRNEIQEYWNNVNKIVEKGQVKDISIPASERKAFIDYMSKPLKDIGKSQEQLDIEKEDIDFDVMVSFLRYKKYDISKLAKIVAQNDKVLSMRERMAKAKNNINSAKNFGNQNRNSGGLSLDTLY